MSSSASSSTSSIVAASSSAASHSITVPSNLKIVGIILAITSGLLIGSSFVFKKKGLLRSQAGGELGEGVAYLKSPLWWTGMTMMILGEICNFAAYAFVEAIVVTPLGALSVVICAILSSLFLNEKLTFFGWLGCGLCILGSVIIALNGPKEETVGEIKEFQKLFLAPGFLSYIIVLILASLVIIFYFAPRYGKKSMLWYISVCSMIGGISVSVTTGLGAAIVETAYGNNQFKYWFMYFLFVFVVITLLVEVYYLNVALALFNTAMVTPTYYVMFTFCSLVTTVVLFQGLKASAAQIITIVMAFLVICFGITILQMSKVDPEKLGLDRRSTLLLRASRQATGSGENAAEKGMIIEDPGMDTLRGSFGTVRSIIRARTIHRLSQSSKRTSHRYRPAGAAAPHVGVDSWVSADDVGLSGLTRHQLYDAPMPRADDDVSIHVPNKLPTIKFGEQDVVHSYNRPGTGDNSAIHEHRQQHGPPLSPGGFTTRNLMPQPDLPTGNQDIGRPSKNLAGTETSGTLVVDSEPSSLSTMYTPLPRLGQRLENLKGLPDMFDTPSGSSLAPPIDRTTLLSFPSVTDSAPSVWSNEGTSSSSTTTTAESVTRETNKRPRSGDSRQSRSRTPKRYPGNSDDKEETESLWQKTSSSVEDESDESGPPPPEIGSVKLVSTTKKP